MTDSARDRLLAKLLAERGLTAASRQGIPARPAGAVVPLTSAQRRLWFLDRIGEAAGSYLVVGSYRLAGELDVPRLIEALEAVLRRHEALRMSVSERDGEPVLLVADQVAPLWTFHDLSAAPRQLARVVADETERPFFLDTAPLLRATLIRLSDAEHVLVLVAHHIVCDDLSLGIVLRDLSAGYGGGDLPALPVQFGDYACWRAQPGDEAAHEAYWVAQLDGAPTVLDLPTDRPRPPAPSGRGRAVDCGQTDLGALAAESGCTPFMIMVAALGTVLGRFADTDDVLIGTAITNRDEPGLADVVGMFVNTVVLRVDLSGEPTVADLLAQVRRTCVDGLSHGDTPLERVIELVNPERDASYNPLFQVMLVLNPATATPAPGGLNLADAGLGSVPARFDLTLVGTHGPDGIRAQLDYATDLFDEPTVRRLAEALRRVLQAMIEDRDARVWEIPLAEPVTCDGGPALDTPPVLDLIDDHSDAPAVIAHDGTLSHRDLAARAADVADRLRELGAGPGTVVGLGMPAGAGAIAALLGILRAGAAYLPLDPGHPPHRLATVLADAGAPILLTTAGHRAAFTGYPGRVLLLDERHRRAPVSDVPPLRSDIAYVIYTSGSSGEPKGVAVGHDALANLAVAFAERHGFGPGDRLLMVPPLSFDASVGDIFPALVSGAALVLPAAPATMTGPELMRECRRLGVTAIDTASALWQQWVADLDPGDVPESLRLVMVGGERVPVGTVRRWAALTGSRIALYNHYGPTEATVCATTYRTVDAAGLSDVDLPIGRPLPGVRAYVLDRRRRPAPPGVPGELYLGGRGVARGYLNRPEETAKRFLPDPFAATPDARMYRTGDRVRYRPADGELEFLGRVDRQVKIRGNRIEPGEVEAVLARHPDVRDAVVAATGSTLTAYVVGNAPGGNGFREWLAERLPDYMVPNTVVTLDALPLTRHGKVDLKALPRPRTGRPTFTAPRGPVEIALASLWSELLDAERVGADDDFFALGGHSLLIPTVIARVRDALGVNVPARALLQAPRLAEFAAAVHRHAAGTAAEPEALPPAATLHADARPPGGVRPRKSKRDSEPGAAFFTGGSGMLGVRLLADVLEHTDTEVHCLIRAGSAQEGAARLRDALATRDRWRPGYAGRIVPVPGDLTRPRFGLDQRRYDELARRTGTIYHSAALINILYPYQMLRPTNVDGTLRVLELAVHDRLKAVHFISTLGVFFGAAFAGRTVTERHEPTDPTGIGSTFATSKWVADGLVREARRRGVPATVYRLARVTGDSVTGESKVDDLFCRMLQTYVQLGAAPGTGELDISPVDYLARAIGLLSRQPRSINRDFHFRTSTTLPQAELTEAITGFGYPLDVVEGPEFWARFGRSERDDLGMAPFAGIRGLPGGAAAPILDCTDTERTVADLGLTHPAPDAELIRRYLEYFVRVGFLPAPRTVEAHHVHT